MTNHFQNGNSSNAARISVVVDTREQLPYAFDPRLFEVTSAALTSGDYSLIGAEGRIAIERKSLSDFIGSITTGRDRFFRELERLARLEFAAVVVESDFRALCSGAYRSKADPASVVGTALAITARFAPVLFAGDRAGGQRMTAGLLRRLWLDSHQPPAGEVARCAQGDA